MKNTRKKWKKKKISFFQKLFLILNLSNWAWTKILLVGSEAKLPPLKEAGLGQNVCYMCLETTC